MADLMNGTYTYDDLANKYGNFVAPAMKIKADGNEITGANGAAVENLSVKLSLGKSNSCTFSLTNIYDREQSGLTSVAKSLALGSIVDVEIGYGSAYTQVFKGYISELEFNFDDIPSLSVSCMDLRCLMMEGKERFCIYKMKKYSDVFDEVMKDYAKLFGGKEVDATEEEFEELQQRDSDFDFVQKVLAKKADREFFVLGDKVYFRTKKKSSSPITTLEWQKNLISFNRGAEFVDIKVKVIGYDPANKKQVEGEATGKADGTVKSPVASGSLITVLSDPTMNDSKKAKKLAKAEAERLKKEAQQGSGTCIGLPEIVPGRFIKVKGLDSGMLDKKYYITEVSHSLGDGFTTTFTIGGWE